MTTQRGINTSARAAISSIPDIEDIPVETILTGCNESKADTMALSDYFKKIMNDQEKESYRQYLKKQIE